MRQKELRIGLVCYGGVSLAVYMHGVTKELWKLARASRAFHSGTPDGGNSEHIYHDLLADIHNAGGPKLRVLPDIITGASAGGINAVFLAQAIHSGQSLEPLTDLWLENADVDRLLDPAASSWTSATKFWAPPLVEMILARPGSGVSESVAPEMRQNVRRKLGRFVRSRWFQPPFSGIGFSGLLADALDAMASAPCGEPLLPPRYPLDLSITATDFHGHQQSLHLHSPPVVQESEHRLAIRFRSRVPERGGVALAHPLELTFAARATASFPGAFPPLKLAEIDSLAELRCVDWPERAAFLDRILPEHLRAGDLANVALIDGSVLVNAPFSEAMEPLHRRPVMREIDRRFVYIDPSPDSFATRQQIPADVGFLKAIFGSISVIPRNQPIRDDLKAIRKLSRDAEQLRRITDGLRPEVEREVDALFGRTFLLDRPTQKRLSGWRTRAQRAAVDKAGYAYHSYSQTRFAYIVDRIARLVVDNAESLKPTQLAEVSEALEKALRDRGLDSLANPRGGASPAALAFFDDHDIRFRIRRLRFLVRSLTGDWSGDVPVTEADRDAGRTVIYGLLAKYFAHETGERTGREFADLADRALADPGAVLDWLSQSWDLRVLDEEVEGALAEALGKMPTQLRRRMLLTYLGFPFYDVATLALLHGEGLSEFDPVKIDRISPDDAIAISEGGARETLRGTEFYNFGAFFSRAYRENDYLWGRLHGSDRMVDLVCSASPGSVTAEQIRDLKRRIFLAILDEEEARLQANPDLVPPLREKILRKLGPL